MATVTAEPYEFELPPETTALLMIDFQRDFVDPGGFGHALGNDVSLLRWSSPLPAPRRPRISADAARLFTSSPKGSAPSCRADGADPV